MTPLWGSLQSPLMRACVGRSGALGAALRITRRDFTTGRFASHIDRTARQPQQHGFVIAPFQDNNNARNFSQSTSESTQLSLLAPERAFAEPGFDKRWLMAVPAFATHMCIGSPYAWSVMSGVVHRELGIVAPSADDWTLTEATIPMSIVFAFHGIGAAMLGKWQMKVGTRASLVTAAGCFGGGLMLGSLGIHIHSLPLVYLGYGVLGGFGLGIGYTPPIQAMIEWFPESKGLASGLCVAGFGSGALLFTPLSQGLCHHFAVPPTYLGPTDAVETITEAGRVFATADGKSVEVVAATTTDLAKLGFDTLSEGFYVVGSGSTGASAALGVLGASYMSVMLVSAFAIRRPHASYKPAGYVPPPPPSPEASTMGLVVAGNVPVDNVMKTPQFWFLGSTFCCVAACGMGVFAVAKPMMTDTFATALPAIVTTGFASSFVMALAASNLLSRLGWASLSDKIGRRTVFHMITFGSIPLYLAVPFLISQVELGGHAWPLYTFVGTSVLAISALGGVYACMPAYEADLFGAKYVGAIHGRFLLASTIAGIGGPMLVLTLRNQSERTAISELVQKVDPTAFERAFGAPVERLNELIDAKTVSIARLMELAPEGVMDPTPFIYNSTMYAMAGMMTAAIVCHLLVRPVNKKWFEKEQSASV